MTAFLAVATLSGAGLFTWFRRLERTGQAVSVVMFVWVVVLVDAVSYPGFDSPAGLLHPTVGSFSFRLPEFVIVLALLARVSVRGLPQRVGAELLWWVAWAAWYAYAGVAGLLAGHPTELISFEGKAIVYVVGAMALAAGVPAADYLGRRGLPRLVTGASVLAIVAIVADQLGTSIHADLPLIPLDRFGELGADAASVFASLGVIALLFEAAQRERRGSWLLRAVPLLLAPLATDQRAALLGLVVSVIVILLAWLRPRARHGLVITPTEVGLMVLAVVGFLLVPTVGRATAEEPVSVNPFGEELRAAFTSPAKFQSAQSRTNLWSEATDLIAEHPFIGWGLGKEYWHFEEGPDEFWKGDSTHNVPLDILLRAGIVGLALLAVALATSLWSGLTAWRRRPNPRVVALGLACAAGVAGMMAKAQVESILEKYLLATTLGLLLGTLRSTATAPPADADDEPNHRGAEEEVAPAWS